MYKRDDLIAYFKIKILWKLDYQNHDTSGDYKIIERLLDKHHKTYC
jgi:hypothetical protein